MRKLNYLSQLPSDLWRLIINKLTPQNWYPPVWDEYSQSCHQISCQSIDNQKLCYLDLINDFVSRIDSVSDRITLKTILPNINKRSVELKKFLQVTTKKTLSEIHVLILRRWLKLLVTGNHTQLINLLTLMFDKHSIDKPWYYAQLFVCRPKSVTHIKAFFENLLPASSQAEFMSYCIKKSMALFRGENIEHYTITIKDSLSPKVQLEQFLKLLLVISKGLSRPEEITAITNVILSPDTSRKYSYFAPPARLIVDDTAMELFTKINRAYEQFPVEMQELELFQDLMMLIHTTLHAYKSTEEYNDYMALPEDYIAELLGYYYRNTDRITHAHLKSVLLYFKHHQDKLTFKWHELDPKKQKKDFSYWQCLDPIEFLDPQNNLGKFTAHEYNKIKSRIIQMSKGQDALKHFKRAAPEAKLLICDYYDYKNRAKFNALLKITDILQNTSCSQESKNIVYGFLKKRSKYIVSLQQVLSKKPTEIENVARYIKDTLDLLLVIYPMPESGNYLPSAGSFFTPKQVRSEELSQYDMFTIAQSLLPHTKTSSEVEEIAPEELQVIITVLNSAYSLTPGKYCYLPPLTSRHRIMQYNTGGVKRIHSPGLEITRLRSTYKQLYTADQKILSCFFFAAAVQTTVLHKQCSIDKLAAIFKEILNYMIKHKLDVASWLPFTHQKNSLAPYAKQNTLSKKFKLNKKCRIFLAKLCDIKKTSLHTQWRALDESAQYHFLFYVANSSIAYSQDHLYGNIVKALPNNTQTLIPNKNKLIAALATKILSSPDYNAAIGKFVNSKVRPKIAFFLARVHQQFGKEFYGQLLQKWATSATQKKIALLLQCVANDDKLQGRWLGLSEDCQLSIFDFLGNKKIIFSNLLELIHIEHSKPSSLKHDTEHTDPEAKRAKMGT